jgi:hypothetical protein
MHHSNTPPSLVSEGTTKKCHHCGTLILGLLFLRTALGRCVPPQGTHGSTTDVYPSVCSAEPLFALLFFTQPESRMLLYSRRVRVLNRSIHVQYLLLVPTIGALSLSLNSSRLHYTRLELSPQHHRPVHSVSLALMNPTMSSLVYKHRSQFLRSPCVFFATLFLAIVLSLLYPLSQRDIHVAQQRISSDEKSKIV